MQFTINVATQLYAMIISVSSKINPAVFECTCFEW